MMTISNLDFLHYMTAVSHEMSDEPKFFGTFISFFRTFISFFRSFISRLCGEFSFSCELLGNSSGDIGLSEDV